ncbi:hypothetical protein Tco_0688817 [Tanacetum coccineum]
MWFQLWRVVRVVPISADLSLIFSSAVEILLFLHTFKSLPIKQIHRIYAWNLVVLGICLVFYRWFHKHLMAFEKLLFPISLYGSYTEIMVATLAIILCFSCICGSKTIVEYRWLSCNNPKNEVETKAKMCNLVARNIMLALAEVVVTKMDDGNEPLACSFGTHDL